MPSIGGIPLPAILIVLAVVAFLFGPRLFASSGSSSNTSLQNLPGMVTTPAGQPPAPSGGEMTVNPEAVDVAGARIEPGQTAVGDVVLNLTLTDAKPMFDAATMTATPGQEQPKPQAGKAPAGYAVLDGLMRKATNNIDASQKASADPTDGKGPLLRHVVLTMKKKSTGDLLPYAEVTMDLLRNGRPVLYDQALVPSVAVNDEGLPQGLHYGNNVAFPGKGNYQFFVRVAPNPFLGSNAPPAAQFNVTFE
jgi:hypothetical protein